MYNGPLSVKKMTRQARSAYFSWHSQKARCYNENDKGYRYYGARGIKQKYSCREFISWWIAQAGNSTKVFVCDRIDPKKDYEFGNIQLISKTENSKRIDRAYMRVSVIWHSPNGDITFRSINEAIIASGITGISIWKHCNGFRRIKKFSYAKTKKRRNEK